MGYYPVYWVKRNQVRSAIKKRIKNSIPENELHLIAFNSSNDIQWTRPGKEFKLGDRMFDVVKDVSKDGEIRFKCVNDIEEQILFADLDKVSNHLLGDDHTPLNKSGKLAIKLISHFEEWQEIPINLSLEVEHNHEILEYRRFFENQHQKIPSPPPQLAA